MKRILYLSRGGSVGGSQRQIYYVLRNLDRSAYEPIVVCLKDGQFVTQLRESRVEAHVLPLRPWRKFPACLHRYLDAEHLSVFARRNGVLLVHSSDLWLNGYLLWVSGRLKIPSILHVRAPISLDNARKHRCSRATLVVAISRRIKKDLLRAGICPAKIVQIDDAVDIEAFGPEELQVDVLRRDFSPVRQVRVGIVGRIEPAKRQFDFVKAAEQIVRNFRRNVTFFVIGDIHSHSYFEKIKRFVEKDSLKRHVLFTGRRDDIPQVLGSLDILVSLSGGSVMFEAMACGKAVISAGFSTEEDSVHIQDGQTGFLVTSRLVSELVRVLIRLIDGPELRRRIGIVAREWAKKKLSHVGMVAETQRLYRRLLREY